MNWQNLLNYLYPDLDKWVYNWSLKSSKAFLYEGSMRAKSKKFLFYSGWGLNYLANAGSICFNKGNTLCNPVLLRVQILVFQTYFSPSKMILVDMPKPLHKKIKIFIKDFFSKCDQIWTLRQTWSHLLKKSIMENFIFLCSEVCQLKMKHI